MIEMKCVESIAEYWHKSIVDLSMKRSWQILDKLHVFELCKCVYWRPVMLHERIVYRGFPNTRKKI